MLHIQPCLNVYFTNKHSSILAIDSSSSHVAEVAVYKMRVVDGGRKVVHSSRCDVSRRAADETLNTSLHNRTQHLSGFSWSAAGKADCEWLPPCSSYNIYIWNFQHGSVQACRVSASETMQTQNRASQGKSSTLEAHNRTVEFVINARIIGEIL